MEEKLKIYIMIKSVTDEAQRKIAGGRLSGMTDIKPMWRIEKLTEVFGPCGLGWYTTTTKKEIIGGANEEKIATVDINLFVNYKKPFNLGDDLWSKPIEGSGGSSFISNEKNGLYTSDECFKMAYTDALSVACKSLGMGAEIYWGDSKYAKKETVETVEQAKNYVLNFGKHKGKKLTEVPEDYLAWLYGAEKTDEVIKKAIDLLNQDKTDNEMTPYDFMLDEDTQKEKLNLINRLNELMLQTNQDHDKLYQHYQVNEQKEMSIEQLNDAIMKLEKKVG